MTDIVVIGADCESHKKRTSEETKGQAIFKRSRTRAASSSPREIRCPRITKTSPNAAFQLLLDRGQSLFQRRTTFADSDLPDNAAFESRQPRLQ